MNYQTIDEANQAVISKIVAGSPFLLDVVPANTVIKEFNERKESKVLKIAFFGTKDYDRTFFSELTKEKGHGTYNSEIKYFTSNLGPETAGMAQGYDAVCVANPVAWATADLFLIPAYIVVMKKVKITVKK